MSGMMTPQAGAPPQLPPQLLAMLMARMQQQQPPAQPQVSGPAQMPQGAPPGQPQMPPQMPPRSMAGIAPPMPGRQGVQGMAAQGRFGDKVMAHLTPGEITVPPQIQSPAVLDVLRQAFAQAGVSPQQFVAGSPAAPINPGTGAEEHSLWSALLPVVGAVVGSVIPGIGTAAGAALGGAAGGAAGGLIDHDTGAGVALSALGGGAGGYVGAGGLGSLLGSGAGAAGSAAGNGVGSAAGAAMSPGQAALMSSAAQSAAAPITQASLAGLTGPGLTTGAAPGLLSRVPWQGAMLAGTGSALGSALAPMPQSSGLPPSFGRPMGPINPNFGQLLGNGQSATPTFANYNPYAAVTGSPYRFY